MLKKAELENEFILTKKVTRASSQGYNFQLKCGLNESFLLRACMCPHKDVDDSHLRAVELVLELEELMGELDFRRVGYDEVIPTIT